MAAGAFRATSSHGSDDGSRLRDSFGSMSAAYASSMSLQERSLEKRSIHGRGEPGIFRSTPACHRPDRDRNELRDQQGRFRGGASERPGGFEQPLRFDLATCARLDEGRREKDALQTDRRREGGCVHRAVPVHARPFPSRAPVAPARRRSLRAPPCSPRGTASEPSAVPRSIRRGCRAETRARPRRRPGKRRRRPPTSPPSRPARTGSRARRLARREPRPRRFARSDAHRPPRRRIRELRAGWLRESLRARRGRRRRSAPEGQRENQPSVRRRERGPRRRG